MTVTQALSRMSRAGSKTFRFFSDHAFPTLTHNGDYFRVFQYLTDNSYLLYLSALISTHQHSSALISTHQHSVEIVG